MNDYSVYLPDISLAYSAFLLGMASPGPNIMAVIGTSMSVGRASGIALALALASGSLTWAVLTVLGLAALLSVYAGVFFIKVFGGLYLLFLAYKAFKSAASPGDIKAQKLAGPETSPIGNALRGYVIQMTNPKAALVWIAIISLGLKQGAPMWGGAAIVIGTFILSVVFHLIYAVAFTTPVMVRVYGRARHYIQATLGAFFAFVGIKLLSSEV